MDQVGLDDVLERSLVFANRCSEGFQADGTPAKFLDEGRQKRAIEAIEAGFVDAESLEGKAGRVEFDESSIAIADRSEIPNPTQ